MATANYEKTYYIPRATRAKAWKATLAQNEKEGRPGVLVSVRDGMTDRVIEDRIRVRFNPAYRAHVARCDGRTYGLRWETTH